jgi:nickel-dependent lactate racemase
MSTWVATGSESTCLTLDEQRRYLVKALEQIGDKPQRVLLIPPDFTRAHSGAGPLTAMLYELLSPAAHVDVMPALGTHVPMTDEEISELFGDGIPRDRFLVHNWRSGLVQLGEVPGEKIAEWSGGKVDYPVKVEVSDRVTDGNYDLILSIGQIVPHEVIGMANYTKNVLVGVGGKDTINKSHYLGAVVGMESIMGRSDTAVRRVLNTGFHTYLGDLPIHFVLTVMEKDHESGDMLMRGLFIGDDDATFELGVELSQKVNLELLDEPLKKVVVYLDPSEFKSTWLGNKSVYRTRLVIADDGELIVLAPGLREFGEDGKIDELIRKYGYRGTDYTLEQTNANVELQENLSAAAHLIHGSSEGRFSITYCPGPGVSTDEIESVGYQAATYDEMAARYNPEELVDGVNILPDGEEIFYISNPALGLWGLKSQFPQ